MSIFKFLIGSILVASSLVGGEDNGWFPVEKPQKSQNQAEEDDPTIWVLFSKNLDSEKFLVRFPTEPSYRYSETGELEIVAEGEEETFILTIQESAPRELPNVDLHYQSEGKWVHEHFVQTDQHLYHFKTLSKVAKSESYREFITSFSIEKNS